MSGSSAAAALVTGAAALVAQARPELDAAALRAVLVGSARALAGAEVGGTVDVPAAATAELAVDPPAAALGAALATGGELGKTLTLRNLSRRVLDVELDVGRTAAAGLAVSVAPRRLRLRPGDVREVSLSARVRLRPRPPSALRGSVLVRVRNGRWFRVPWVVPVPLAGARLVSGLVLSRRVFAPSETRPAVVAFTAGRVDGTRERPQLRALARLDVDLYRGGRLVGTLATLRDLLPGRYAFGLTGRGPRGARLQAGEYEVRVVATPLDGGPKSESRIGFRIR